MGFRQATYAFGRPVPYLLERGAAQTIQAPVRYGSAGGLVAPDSGTISVEKPDGTFLVSEEAVTISSSIAQYTLTPSSSEALGEGWTVYWDLTIGGVAYPTFRQAAYLCKHVPPNVISANDLYSRRPELEARVPQKQGARGDDVGWQPQIDEAYYELIQRLLDDGRRPWLIREVTGYRSWLLTRALQLCVQAIPGGLDSSWAQASKDLAFELRGAEARLRFQYDDEAATVRRGGSPVIRLAPTGRPLWR
jgi:hypothetical protein